MGRRNKTSWVVVAMPVEGPTQAIADVWAGQQATALTTLLNEYARVVYGPELVPLLREVAVDD